MKRYFVPARSAGALVVLIAVAFNARAQTLATSTLTFEDVPFATASMPASFFSAHSWSGTTPEGGGFRVDNGVFVENCPCVPGNPSTVYGTNQIAGLAVTLAPSPISQVHFQLYNGAFVTHTYRVRWRELTALEPEFGEVRTIGITVPARQSVHVSLPGSPTNGFNVFPPDGLTNGWLYFIDDISWQFTSTTPPVFDFVLGSNHAGEKFLISEKRSDDSSGFAGHFSRWQEMTLFGDTRYRVEGAAKRNGAGVTVPVYLRVLDPADPSPYLSGAADDNRDLTLPKGRLYYLDDGGLRVYQSATGILEVPANREGVTGRVVAYLEITDRHAGDNYQIEASLTPDFACANAGSCKKSTIITAWKRIYVEKRKMLRNGIFLAQHARAGATEIRLQDNRYRGNHGNRRVARGDVIVLVHAPQIQRADLANGWYSEVHNVLKVTHDRVLNEWVVELGTRHQGTVTREQLQHSYDRDAFQPSIGDAVSYISGQSLSAADVFDASDALARNSVFGEAFTEYTFLADATTPGADVPVPHLTDDDQVRLQALADKWSSVVTWDGAAGRPLLMPNHQLLIIGDREVAPDRSGLTISLVRGETSSFVWRGVIDNISAQRGISSGRWAEKTVVHELAHQWRANAVWSLADPDAGDHCPATTKTFDDPTVYCLLAKYSDQGTNLQLGNGIARFHAPMPSPGGSTHSEYLEIRSRANPFRP